MPRSILAAAVLASLWPSAARAQLIRPTDSQFAYRMEGSFSGPLDQARFPFDGRIGGSLRLGIDIPGGFTPMIGVGLGVGSTSSSTTTTTSDQFTNDRTIYSAVLSLQARYYTSRHGTGLAPF